MRVCACGRACERDKLILTSLGTGGGAILIWAGCAVDGGGEGVGGGGASLEESGGGGGASSRGWRAASRAAWRVNWMSGDHRRGRMGGGGGGGGMAPGLYLHWGEAGRLPVRSPDLQLPFARYFFDLQALHVLLLRYARNVVGY
jgi:hypothetical protein